MEPSPTILNYADRPRGRLIVAELADGVLISEPCRSIISFWAVIGLLIILFGAMPSLIVFELFDSANFSNLHIKLLVVLACSLLGGLFVRTTWIVAKEPKLMTICGDKLILLRHNLWRRYERAWPLAEVSIVIVRGIMDPRGPHGSLRLMFRDSLPIDVFSDCPVAELEWISSVLKNAGVRSQVD